MKTPEEYRAYITGNGPKAGELTIDPGWFDLWPFEQLEEINKSYEVEKNVPGFYGFGSNGGGELFAFDLSGQVFMIPFIPMEKESAVKVASSWSEFEYKIKK